MRAPDRSAAHVERRDDDLVGAKPFHAEHGSNDVDNRIEGTHFVQMDALDRHIVNCSLCLRQLLEQRHRPILPCSGKG